MRLATRCTACGTVFRVVRDQLRVSEGWVRCGRCGEVFSASDQLFDLDREAPPPWPAPAAATTSSAVAATHGIEAEADAATLDDSVSRLPAHAIDDGDEELPAWARSAPPRPPPPRQRIGDDDDDEGEDFADARFNLDLLDPPPPAPPTPRAPGPVARATDPDAHDAPWQAAAALDAVAAGAAAAPPPEFVRRAERSARDARPLMRRLRLAAWIALPLLAVALLLQLALALALRTPLLARWPGALPLLQPLCAVAGCTVEPLRLLDHLVVDASSLSRLDAPGLYRLTLQLHNRGPLAAVLPAIDIMFTDGQGQLVARRVLQPTELGATRGALDGGAELSLQATLQGPPERRIVGYTLEIFYP